MLKKHDYSFKEKIIKGLVLSVCIVMLIITMTACSQGENINPSESNGGDTVKDSPDMDRQEPEIVDIVDRQDPVDEPDINWQQLESDYNPPDIGGLLKAITESNTAIDGSINITYAIKREFNQMDEDYRFFFMPNVAWYDFESVGRAISYLFFTWTGEFGTFPEKIPQYSAEARLQKIFAAPDNKHLQIEHKLYPKSVLYEDGFYSPWPESYNADVMIYDLVELKVLQEENYTYYTATANEYGFDVNGYYEPGVNEEFLFAKSEALGLESEATLGKLLETGDIAGASKSGTYIIEFRVEDNNTTPMIVSVNRFY